MSSVNNTNGTVDFWAELKKKKEEEARQKEQEARELEMQSAMQQDEIDNLPEPEPDDDFIASEVVQEPTGDDEKEIISDGNTEESEDEIGEEELIRLVKISARINEKVDEVMKDMAKEFDVPFSQVVRLAIDGHLEKYLGTVRYIDGDQGEYMKRATALIANELQGIKTALNKLGVNVNQLAKWNNIDRRISLLEKQLQTANPSEQRYINMRLQELHRAQAACNWSYFTLFSVEKYMEQLDNASERIGKELWHTQE
ncbi:hypothetical protein FYJ25_00265 [Anaerobutyricum soehngenii]|uniref:Uncharacterized protein n=1 Tax=Anaerobutyricum soehngenii TaxID=105843 RepID=A0A6N7YBE0_9FIRM|nr:hypothetical protein [Anaerobutyricum soehngenii]MSU80834.1 hypothetical protein [Anaerobutyricum soehngenii]